MAPKGVRRGRDRSPSGSRSGSRSRGGSQTGSDGRSESGSRMSGSFSGSYLEGEESEEELDSEEERQMEEREKLVHWWCRKQLSRCLKKLRGLPEAGPFLEPLPWQELGLDDYLDVITDPIDLKTIGERLEKGEYEDDDGLIDPDYFWEDIMLVWENCKLYYEGDEEAEPFQMAEEMRVDAEAMEEEFWAELERFESSLESVSGNLANVAAVADVAASHVEDKIKDAAWLAEDLGKGLANWWWGAPPSTEDGGGPMQDEEIYFEARSIVKAESPFGKGKVTMKFQEGVPVRKDNREAMMSDTIKTLAETHQVDEEEIEIDWDEVWKAPEDVKHSEHERGGVAGKVWEKIDIPYRLLVDDQGELKEIVEDFDPAVAKNNFKQAFGKKVQVEFEEMAISKPSRRPLSEHYFDLILERCGYDAMQDLQDIEEELTQALRKLLPIIKEIDGEDERLSHLPFPEVHKKISLHQLSGPKFNRGGGSTKTRGSLSSKPSSMATLSDIGTPRDRKQSTTSGGVRSARVSLVGGGAMGAKISEKVGRMTSTKHNADDRAEMLKKLMMESSSSEDEGKSNSPSSPKSGGPIAPTPTDINKLQGMYRKRDKNAGERMGHAPSTRPNERGGMGRQKSERPGERRESTATDGGQLKMAAKPSEPRTPRGGGGRNLMPK